MAKGKARRSTLSPEGGPGWKTGGTEGPTCLGLASLRPGHSQQPTAHRAPPLPHVTPPGPGSLLTPQGLNAPPALRCTPAPSWLSVCRVPPSLRDQELPGAGTGPITPGPACAGAQPWDLVSCTEGKARLAAAVSVPALGCSHLPRDSEEQVPAVGLSSLPGWYLAELGAEAPWTRTGFVGLFQGEQGEREKSLGG